MNVYMVTHKKQNCIKGEWFDNTSSNHTFYIIAENENEAKEYAESALVKVNEHATVNERYVSDTEPKQINVVSVTHDINRGTSVTGIWD